MPQHAHKRCNGDRERRCTDSEMRVRQANKIQEQWSCEHASAAAESREEYPNDNPAREGRQNNVEGQLNHRIISSVYRAHNSAEEQYRTDYEQNRSGLVHEPSFTTNDGKIIARPG